MALRLPRAPMYLLRNPRPSKTVPAPQLIQEVPAQQGILNRWSIQHPERIFLHQNLFLKAFLYISRLTRFPSSVTGWRNQFYLNLKTQQQNITDRLYFNSWS